MARVKAQPLGLPQKFVDMAARWHAAASESVDAEGLGRRPHPPKRWCRDDVVRQAMTARWGARYTAYRELLRRAMAKEVVPEFPIHLDFDVKDLCNLACVNCSENFRDWTGTVTDLSWLRSDPFFAKRQLLAANIGNAAEPFLRPDLTIELIRFLRAHDVIDIFLHTNGILLTTDVIERLIEHEVTWVSVSLDARTEATFRTVRGKGYERAHATINLLLDRRRALGRPFPFVRVSFFVVPENWHEAFSFYDHWKDVVDMVEFQDFWTPNPPGIEETPNIASHPLFEQISGAECPQPFYRMSVNASGVVGPCCSSYGHDAELKLGDVNRGASIEEMWRSEKMQSIRTAHRKKAGPAAFATCTQCLRQNYRYRHYAEESPGGE